MAYTADGDFYAEPSRVWEEVISLRRPGEKPDTLAQADVV
jgi:hypothetical protein